CSVNDVPVAEAVIHSAEHGIVPVKRVGVGSYGQAGCCGAVPEQDVAGVAYAEEVVALRQRMLPRASHESVQLAVPYVRDVGELRLNDVAVGGGGAILCLPARGR